MTTAEVKKLISNTTSEFAVVLRESVQKNEPTQSAQKVEVIGIMPDGEPVDQNVWRYGVREAAKKRTVKGKVMASDNRFIKRGEIVYFEPRRILSTWKDYEAAKQQKLDDAERWERERAKSYQEKSAIARRLKDMQETLSLTREGYLGDEPLFSHSAYGDGSGELSFDGDVDDVFTLLERLAKAEGKEI